MSDSSSKSSIDRATLLSGLVLLIPPLLALLAGLFPGTVPVPFVDIDDPHSIQPFLLALGAILLVLNAGVLLLLRKSLIE